MFGALTPLEPRLGKKLIEPLTNLIHSTSAMSLLYECINTVIAVLISISSGMPNHTARIQFCVQKLGILIEDSDQNLKYLGLLAMSKILKTHPKSVQAHKDLILLCLEDKDESIRLRALDLLCGMVSKKNLMEIVKKLMMHMDKAEGTVYRDELLSKIVQICSQNSYQFITSFEWYVTVLIELAGQEFGAQKGRVLALQLVDVCVRVHAIRVFAVQELAILLEQHASTTSPGSTMFEVLLSAAFLCGEFASLLPQATVSRTLKHLLAYANLPPHIHAVFIQNSLKLAAQLLHTHETQKEYDAMLQICDDLTCKMKEFVKSAELEVQERASNTLQIVDVIKNEITKRSNEDTPSSEQPLISDELLSLFSGELNPVAPKAQKKVPIPDGLDLDAWINSPPSESDSASDVDDVDDIFLPKQERQDISTPSFTGKDDRETKGEELTQEQINQLREARRQEQLNNPHYLKTTNPKKSTYAQSTDSIPITELNLSVPLRVGSEKRSDHYMNLDRKGGKASSKKHKKKSKKDSPEISDNASDLDIVVNQSLDMPEGATFSDDSHSSRGANFDDPHRALNIDLDTPLDDDNVGHKRLKGEKIKKTKKHKKRIKTEKPQKEDEDLNLLGDVVAEKTGDKKAKREKREKKDKKKEKEGKTVKNKKPKTGYEEAAGISTPSTEFH